VTAPNGDPRPRLGVALPELPPAMLCAAFTFARDGADADSLVRSLRLTRRQALAVVAGSRG